jgi:CheY-like chemotaxis protein
MEKLSPKLLIIDDEPDVLETIGLMLKKEGYSIEFAANGLEALDQIINKKFDLVICDFIMPKMDGLKLLTTLREKNNLTPFVFFSGNSGDEEELKIANLGAHALLTKEDIFKLPAIVKKSIIHARGIIKLAEKHTEEADDFLKILHSTK